MDEIEHKFIEVNGLKIHVAEIGSGTGPVVLFLHGFPEIWYSWRFQMLGVAKAGFRAISIDHRGYALSDQPPQPDKTTFLDLVNDIAALLDTLSIPKEPRRFESDFARFDVKTVLRKIYILFSRTEILIAAEDQEIMDLVDSSAPLPSWFTEEDLQNYTALYEKYGFRTALQISVGDRSLNKKFQVPNQEVDAPALFVMCGKDYLLKFPGIGDYIRSGQAKNIVPKANSIDNCNPT